MATITNVLDALVTQATDALAAAAPLITPEGATVVYQAPLKGAINPQTLRADIANNTSNVSVTRLNGVSTPGKTAIDNWGATTPPTQTLIATLSAAKLTGGAAGVAASGTITFSGTLTAGTIMIVDLGGAYVSYAITAADLAAPVPLNSLANNLAAAVNGQVAGAFTATATGAAVRIADVSVGVQGNAIGLAISLGGQATVVQELRRQKDKFEINVWAPDEDSRSLIADTIDTWLAAMHHLGPFPDGSYARLRFVRAADSDLETRDGIYRRLLEYTVEYVTTKVLTAVQVLEGSATVSGSTSMQLP